ncbi:hypothetical protein K438DRAFT_1601222 [Mycena galopus ATCC 62051]|nr:hypothetical protein K438DRAFT_1601222 [Mycena galopus ATCC 62051]
MSLTRASLVVVQMVFNELASTPPNPSPEKGRYGTDQLWIFRIAPMILRIHQLLLRLCTVFEILHYFASLPLISPHLSPFSPYFSSIAPSTAFPPTSLFLTGVLLVSLGALLRLACFRALGPLFTFVLSIHPKHQLVTSGPYSIVRHPAYTGSLSIVGGLALSHLSPGSWLHLARTVGTCLAGLLGALWFLWTLAIGLSRVRAEDAQMCMLFPKEWDAYAERVKWWFVPGVI